MGVFEFKTVGDELSPGDYLGKEAVWAAQMAEGRPIYMGGYWRSSWEVCGMAFST